MSTEGTVESAAAALASKYSATPETEAQDEQESESQDEQDTPHGEPEEGTEGTPEPEEGAEQEPDPEQEPEEPKKASAIDTAVVKMRIGDQERDVTVAELKNGYLRQADYSRKTEEVAEARKSFVGQAKQYEAHIQGQLHEVGFLAQTLMQQLVADEQGTDWNELRTKNPAEYAAKQHDVQQRRTLLERSYKAYQEAQQRQGALGQEEYQSALAEQASKLLVEIPEWIDSRVRQAEQKAVAKYLISVGVPEQSVSALADAKTVAIARKAMLWDNQQGARDKAKEKLRKPVPPLQKSGVRDPNPIRSTQAKQFAQAKKTGKAEDFAEALASKYR